MNSTKIQWLRLSGATRIGPRSFIELLNIFQTAENAIDYLSELNKRGRTKGKINIPSYSEVEREMEYYDKIGAHVLIANEKNYPKMLKEISNYPPVLVCRGRLELLLSNKIAVVGSRNASSNGLNFAKTISRDLGAAGYVVVSGLAKGIDAAAHSGALKFGTIGVISCGINIVYPKENQKLHEELYERGLVITEYRLDQHVMPEHFPQRNRIISGLAYGTLVIEAAKRSGTLITAHYALEQNREIFAVPGSPFDVRCEGTNELIKQGAILVQRSQDILSELSRIVTSQHELFKEKISEVSCSVRRRLLSEDEMKKYKEELLSSLSFSPTHIEDVMAVTNIPRHIFNLLVIELELAGIIERTYNNKLSIIAEQLDL